MEMIEISKISVKYEMKF